MNETEKRIAKQKVIARLVLEKTRKYFPSAIITGGAPRNWHVGMVAKDIDIFLMQDASGKLDQIVYDLRKNPDDLVQLKGQVEEEVEEPVKLDGGVLGVFVSKKTVDYDPNDIIEVWELEVRGEKIQWVFLNQQRCSTPKEFVMETFDFEICKMFFTDGVIELSPGAQHDFDNKILSLSVESLTQHDRLYSLPGRAAKMQKLFPSFKLKINK